MLEVQVGGTACHWLTSAPNLHILGQRHEWASIGMDNSMQLGTPVSQGYQTCERLECAHRSIFLKLHINML